MWKTVIILFTILVSVLGSILFWQWNAYSDQGDLPRGKQLEEANQQITVETKGELLQITQQISGLSTKQEYRIVFPDSIKEWNCINEDGDSCNSNDENPSTFLAEDGFLTVKYSVKPNKGSFLLNDWIGRFPDVSIIKSSIEIIDSMRREGTWVAGIPLKGFEKLKNIDYYVFEGSENTPSLFWLSEPLSDKKARENMEYYLPNSSKSPSYNLKALENIPNLPYLSVIFTNRYPETNGEGIIIAKPGIEDKVLERKIIYNYFAGKLPYLQLEEKWIIDCLTSLLTNQDSKVNKGTELIQDLKGNFLNEELNQFLDEIIQDESVLETKDLDRFLGSIKGKETDFFTVNKNETTKFIPLYFYDPKKVLANGKVQKDIKMVYVQNDRYFPFAETMTALGYNVKLLSNKESLLLSKGNNSYRFYADQNIFIYNEEDYGLFEKPLTVLNGKIYIKSQWLQSIFKVSINEEDNQVILSMLFE